MPASTPWVVTTRPRVDADVAFRPILDLARGVVAGYQAIGHAAPPGPASGEPTDPLATVTAALAAAPSLPVNTFVTIPLRLGRRIDPAVLDALHAYGDLSGIVLDLADVPEDLEPELRTDLEGLRVAGAIVALGGDDAPQPPLRSVVRLRPAIIRLGRAWVEGIEHSAEKRGAIEVTGTVAGQLDAWVLAEGVRTPAELRTLAELGVPLAQGPLVGAPHGVWQDAGERARQALSHATPARADGVLRGLLRRAYTTGDLESARSVLPDAAGFEVVVAVDEHRRPRSLLVKDEHDHWRTTPALGVHVDTPVADVVGRALARPRDTRFVPVVCTDSAGGFLGIIHLEDLMTHLADGA